MSETETPDFADLDRRVRESPSDPNAWTERGQARADTGEYEQAVEDFARACGLAPKSPVPFAKRAYCLLLLERPAEAVDDAAKAEENAPKDAKYLMLHGMACDAAGDHDAAIAIYTRTMELDPRYFQGALNNRGVAHASKGDHESAIRDFSDAARIHPDDHRAFANRAVSFLERGETKMDGGDIPGAEADFRSGLADLEKALDLGAGTPEVEGLVEHVRKLMARAEEMK
jgi:Flp pilus assembly protein TadD